MIGAILDGTDGILVCNLVDIIDVGCIVGEGFRMLECIPLGGVVVGIYADDYGGIL